MDSKTETTWHIRIVKVYDLNINAQTSECNTYQYDKKSIRQYFREANPPAQDSSVLTPAIRVLSRKEKKEIY